MNSDRMAISAAQRAKAGKALGTVIASRYKGVGRFKGDDGGTVGPWDLVHLGSIYIYIYTWYFYLHGYHQKSTKRFGKYTSHMDPMGWKPVVMRTSSFWWMKYRCFQRSQHLTWR